MTHLQRLLNATELLFLGEQRGVDETWLDLQVTQAGQQLGGQQAGGGVLVDNSARDNAHRACAELQGLQRLVGVLLRVSDGDDQRRLRVPSQRLLHGRGDVTATYSPPLSFASNQG